MSLVITGHQRSGTTLLMQLCDSHPQISVANEFGCFFHMNQSYWSYGRHLLARWGFVQAKWSYRDSDYFRRFRRFHNLAFALSYLWHLFPFRHEDIGSDAVAAALQGAFAQKCMVGDKLPQYMPILDKLAEGEKLSCVVIYRDCRDVTSSFLVKVRTTWRTRDWAPEVDTAEKIARNWVRMIELMERHAHGLYIVRYEELVRQPKKVLAELGDWLGVNPSAFNHNLVSASNIGNYKEGLSEMELDTVLEVAGAVLGRLGYV